MVVVVVVELYNTYSALYIHLINVHTGDYDDQEDYYGKIYLQHLLYKHQIERQTYLSNNSNIILHHPISNAGIEELVMNDNCLSSSSSSS